MSTLSSSVFVQPLESTTVLNCGCPSQYHYTIFVGSLHSHPKTQLHGVTLANWQTVTDVTTHALWFQTLCKEADMVGQVMSTSAKF